MRKATAVLLLATSTSVWRKLTLWKLFIFDRFVLHCKCYSVWKVKSTFIDICIKYIFSFTFSLIVLKRNVGSIKGKKYFSKNDTISYIYKENHFICLHTVKEYHVLENNGITIMSEDELKRLRSECVITFFFWTAWIRLMSYVMKKR